MSVDAKRRRAAHSKYLLARAWHSKGIVTAAITGYREALELDPAHLEARIMLGSLLVAQARIDEALNYYRRGLDHHPNDPRFHKGFVNAMLRQSGTDAVFDHYQLIRKDARHLNPRPADILCCVVLRNELARLPYFLEFYRTRGVSTFIAVDNGSDDGSLEYLLCQPDVFVWQSRMSFNRANFGAGWVEPILRLYGHDRWCLIVDADELLYYSECERRNLVELCRSLDRRGQRAFTAVHLDMYSDVAISETEYVSGQPFEEVCCFFDRNFCHRTEENSGLFRNQLSYYGGVRQRVFGGTGYYLSKVPLIKYAADCILAGGQHCTNLPKELIADQTGCLLHFKYFSSFSDRVHDEVRRKEHYGDAMLYREYERGLRREESLTFYDPAHSVKFEGSAQLVRLGIVQAELNASSRTEPVFPRVEPVPPGTPRPFWSVLLTVYRRTEYLELALRSVLEQAPDQDSMQIEIICDGPDPAMQVAIEAMVRSVGGERVSVYWNPVRAGHPDIFNVCLSRARGLWVHILHDDDVVAPGFYEALRSGIIQCPGIGAAFCRHTYIDHDGCSVRLSLLERETPGIIEDWLDRIAGECRLQTSSIVVRREAYEKVGGYCPQAASAFDWEMWQRLAVHYPFWYEPAPLAFFRQTSESESARLMKTGQQIADTRGVIEIARSYLPRARVGVLSRRAGDHYALWAFDIARSQLEAGNAAGALANLGEGLRCSQSDEVKNQLFSLLSQFPKPRA